MTTDQPTRQTVYELPLLARGEPGADFARGGCPSRCEAATSCGSAASGESSSPFSPGSACWDCRPQRSTPWACDRPAPGRRDPGHAAPGQPGLGQPAPQAWIDVDLAEMLEWTLAHVQPTVRENEIESPRDESAGWTSLPRPPYSPAGVFLSRRRSIPMMKQNAAPLGAGIVGEVPCDVTRLPLPYC